MKKVLSVVVLVLLFLGLVGCEPKVVEEERTYVADGVYVAWELGTNTGKVLNNDGTVYTLGEGETAETFKSVQPVLSTVSVEIRNDKIVRYTIDERQAKSFVKSTAEDGTITGVTWAFNAQTKRELKYGYGMESGAAQGEWFQTIVVLENSWLKSEPKAVSSVTIYHESYVTLANEAIKMAKDGKVSAITPGEHYTYDVAHVEANVSKEGKLSNVKFDANIFGYNQVAADVYKADKNVFQFTWAAESKYDSYAPMSNNVKWQDQIDTLEEYIEENGFDGLLGSNQNATSKAHKGLIMDGVVPEALASVTIQANGEIYVLTQLLSYFPNAWTE
jgi:major membrane immunogen (membrane-anchored lipoprotein)